MPYDPDNNCIATLTTKAGREVVLLAGDGEDTGNIAYTMQAPGNKVMAIILRKDQQRDADIDACMLEGLDKRYDEFVRISEDRLGKLKEAGVLKLKTPEGNDVAVVHLNNSSKGWVAYLCLTNDHNHELIHVVIADDFYQMRYHDFDDGILKHFDKQLSEKVKK